MKTMFVSIAMLITAAACAQTKVIAEVSNFRNDKGVCRACIFSSEAAYDKHQPLQCQQVTISGGHAQVIFQNLPVGTYVVSVFHDANNNSEFDTNFLGIPKEGYGSSCNKLPFASAPSFKDNQFQVKENTITTLAIRLRNL